GRCTTPQPLAILENPKDVHALQGGTATFTVRAQGAPPLHFQWLFNGSALNGANQSTLTLMDLQLPDIGTYAVTVTDATGSLTSAVARLTLTFDLAITESPGNLMVVAGEDATFTVRAQGTEPLSYRWYFQGAQLIGETNATLTLSGLKLTNAGRYLAVVA